MSDRHPAWKDLPLSGSISLGLLIVVAALAWLASAETVTATHTVPPRFVWPVSGSSTPDLPQSSAYGPRLRYGCGGCYDYHQGLDIPTPANSTLHAVTTGTVRIAGSHPAYRDGVVQLDHGNGLYSNYLHITASMVTTGQVVNMGDPVALSGISESGFPHLHFEIRDGSVWRRDTINPLRYLPYTDTIGHAVRITDVLASGAIWMQVTAPATELDVNRFTITVRSRLTDDILDQRVLDYEERNKQYDGDPDDLDVPDMDGVLISPHIFRTRSTTYTVDLKFHGLAGAGPVTIDACAFDVHDNASCAQAGGVFEGGGSMWLPLIVGR